MSHVATITRYACDTFSSRLTANTKLLARKEGVDMVITLLTNTPEEFGFRSDDYWRYMIIHYGSTKDHISAMKVYEAADKNGYFNSGIAAATLRVQVNSGSTDDAIKWFNIFVDKFAATRSRPEQYFLFHALEAFRRGSITYTPERLEAAKKLVTMMSTHFASMHFPEQALWTEKVKQNALKEEDFPKLIGFFKKCRWAMVSN